ncbi:ArsR/SmtB family transcription factor [Francisella frigiditurris]|uniref:Bacterial regulatory, arsR family protein n=1 Tax=Francisella frigiditurris TaxID=1542390 RepID=A0A1J0KUL3_9GAMM|nr:metalloregulator ArsR/SmtB family transcription factor [Francisella frigiditurris]APC97367.1 bacterial regulatory, arsR family protein [Francisella frigiditurris]
MEKIFKALGDRTRLDILLLISLNPDICLCHLENCFELSNSNLSRHLKELEQSGLVTSYKKTKWKHYQLSAIGNELAELIIKVDDQNSLLEQIRNKSKLINICQE